MGKALIVGLVILAAVGGILWFAAWISGALPEGVRKVRLKKELARTTAELERREQFMDQLTSYLENLSDISDVAKVALSDIREFNVSNRELRRKGR